MENTSPEKEAINKKIQSRQRIIEVAQKQIKALELEKVMLASVPMDKTVINSLMVIGDDNMTWTFKFVLGNYNRFCLCGNKPYFKGRTLPLQYENEKEAEQWLRDNYASMSKLD
jgi:hypothetical protein